MAGPLRNRMTLVVVCALVLLARCAWAGTGSSFVLPLSSPQTTFAGVMLKVDTDWVQGYGHRPVRLELISAQPTAEDRQLTVDVSVNGFLSRPVVVSTELTLPAGRTSVVHWVPVPQLPESQYVTIKTYFGGREIEELSVENQGIGNSQYWGADGGFPRILFVGDAPPDVSGFSYLSQAYASHFSGSMSFREPKDVFAFMHQKADQLFGEPLYYSALDVVMMSKAEAEGLAKNRPEVWRALCEWNRSGGTLCLYGVAQDAAELEQFETLVQSPPNPKQAAEPLRGWLKAEKDAFEAAASSMIAWQNSAQAAIAQQSGGPQPAFKLPKMPKQAPFVWRQVGFGNLVAWTDPQPFPGKDLDWQWLFNTLPPSSTRWPLRIGSVPDGENPTFNEFLIADVGLPPIRTYRVLITLFVVLIGPVNYWLLRRAGRLYLFLFTVPLAALLTTGALLGYALVSDGLDSRLRASSLTLLDQRSGQATSMARLSYYAGIAPSGGLEFSRDTLIVPVELSSPPLAAMGANPRRIDWEDQQHLARGWLASRTPTQYVTLRSYADEGTLALTPAASGAPLKGVNRLGVEIHQLLVCDEAGEVRFGSELAAGKPFSLQAPGSKQDQTDALLKFLKVYDLNVPALPVGMDPFGTASGWSFFGRRRYYGSQKQLGGEGSGLDSRLQELRTKIAAGGLAPRSYVAIVQRPPQVEVGLEELIETQSTHVIQGQW